MAVKNIEKSMLAQVDNWVSDIDQLSDVAKDEPQLAYAAFTKAICHRWCFIQRTIPNISDLFAPLEEIIREKLIPAVIGRKVPDVERRVLALPVRYGGLGISNPVLTVDRIQRICGFN